MMLCQSSGEIGQTEQLEHQQENFTQTKIREFIEWVQILLDFLLAVDSLIKKCIKLLAIRTLKSGGERQSYLTIGQKT